jgi:uncharacterized protein (DUF488 family)
VEIYTIGFTRRPAAAFFGALKEHGICRLVDIRLHNSSQLAAFAKRDDLAYFLDALCDIEYRHEPMLAPIDEILQPYRHHETNWDQYAAAFRALIGDRRIEDLLDRDEFQSPTVLLCSELKPDHCHRRLVVEYLAEKWGGVRPVHL